MAELRGELALAALAALPALLATYAFGLSLSALLRSGASAMTVALVVWISWRHLRRAPG